MRLKFATALIALHCAIGLGLVSANPASARGCGRISGTKVQAYNLGCREARSIFEGPLPTGWMGANADIAGGIVFYCHAVDQETVAAAIDWRSGRVHPRQLRGAPLVLAKVPYGE
jgi:hypothetical protein